MTVNGVQHHGYFEIQGTRKLRLLVHYQDRQLSDEHDYLPGQERAMELVAAMLLEEMVTDRDRMRPARYGPPSTSE